MLKKIKNNLYLVAQDQRAGFPYCHSLYVEDEVRALVDCSMHAEDEAELLNKRPDIILNTHFHEDHILNNPKFKAECDSLVSAHILDAPAIASKTQFLKDYGFAEMGMAEVGEAFINDLSLTFSSVDETFSDGMIWDFGKTQLTVVHLPGHSPGHCGFYYEPENLLWGADIELSRFGPWYGHKVNDLDAFIASIDRCITINPQIFISSHQGVITENTIGRLTDFKTEIFRKEEAVYQSVTERPGTLIELADRALYYGANVKRDPFTVFQERYALYHLLTRLVKYHQLRFEQGVYMID